MHCFKKHHFGPVIGYELGFAPIGTPPKTVYIYLIDTTLIDTGPHHMDRFVRRAFSSTAISRILLTHHHEDHSGNAALLKSLHNIPIFIHPYGGDKLKNGFNILPYQHLLFGKAPKFTTAPLPDEIETEHHNFQVIHTPGHSKDHTVFYEKNNGWIFSGDLYIGEKIHFFRSDERIEEQVRSLEKVLRLDFDTIFCAHRPALEKGRKKLQRKLDFLKEFHERVGDLFLHGSGEKEIIRKLRIKNDFPIRVFTMGNASFSHMVRSSLRSHQSLFT